jgi:hypothetical protein
MIALETIADSIGANAPRLWTVKTISPTMTHQETLRHRTIYCEDALRGDFDFSYSVSSTRAIPFTKTLADVRTTPAKPVFWGGEQRGMQSSDEDLSNIKMRCPDGGLRTPDEAWELLANINADWAQCFANAGHHKSTSNRILSTYNHTHCLWTGTEPGWMNFFGLRLDTGADKTLRALAEALWKEWNEHKPTTLKPGEWHLPFIEDQDYENTILLNPQYPLEVQRNLIKISVARCARLSYESFTTNRRSTIEEDLDLYQRLVGGPIIHASPAEHQATPDEYIRNPSSPYDAPINPSPSNSRYAYYQWKNPQQSGNLGPGWCQYRKMLPSEALAPLPKEYQQ